MTQFVRECLALENRGWSRREIEALIRTQPQFSRSSERNPKALGEMIRRLLGRGEIVDRDGQLFASHSMQLAVRIHCERFELIRDA